MAQVVLDEGDRVVATARNPSSLSFHGANPENFLALKLDVTSNSDIDAAFNSALRKFGRIDVVVNNAGYALTGAFKTIAGHQIRAQFNTNFFGVMDVTRRAIDVMRQQTPPGGLIQQVSSISGQISVPMTSIYSASKWAVEGFTEAVSKEVKHEWNIRFTCIEPGRFGTDCMGRSLTFEELEDGAYDHLDARKTIGGVYGTEPGDVIKGARTIYKLAVIDEPPFHCVLGDKAYQIMQAKKLWEYLEVYDRVDILDFVRNVDSKYIEVLLPG